LGDAARTQVDYDEDREDYDSEDETDSLALSNTNPEALKQELSMEQSKMSDYDREQMMWEYVIEKHGKKEFEAVYAVISQYRDNRFSEEAQKHIAEEVQIELSLLGMSDTQKQQELIGLVSSFMIIEEFK
jgi:hypothetical protein